MSRGRTFLLRENDLHLLEDVTQALGCLEHLLVTQEKPFPCDIDTQHLAALLSLLTAPLGKVTDTVRHGQKARISRRKQGDNHA